MRKGAANAWLYDIYLKIMMILIGFYGSGSCQDSNSTLVTFPLMSQPKAHQSHGIALTTSFLR